MSGGSPFDRAGIQPAHADALVACGLDVSVKLRLFNDVLVFIEDGFADEDVLAGEALSSC
jgi:hypothetical protein